MRGAIEEGEHKEWILNSCKQNGNSLSGICPPSCDHSDVNWHMTWKRSAHTQELNPGGVRVFLSGSWVSPHPFHREEGLELTTEPHHILDFCSCGNF